MFSYFKEKKKEIAAYLEELFKEKSVEFSKISSMGADICNRLYRFSIQGKMIRGGLVSVGYSLFKNDHSKEQNSKLLIKAAAAMELLQSALLVHDDIMDRDQTRRGAKTIFYQYKEMTQKQGLDEPYHLGESLGICVGDIAFFLAFEILSAMKIDPFIHREILRLCAREISYVGVAQMQDVYWGASKTPVDDEEILRLYLYKTGRYTFSLPLMIGALLARQPREKISLLEKLGEYLGIMFQIKDDELGLFGDETHIGKPVGSDIKEGKKTLYYGYLQRRASSKDRSKFSSIFGNENITQKELEYIRNLTVSLGIREMVSNLVSELAKKAKTLIPSADKAQTDAHKILLEFLDYNMERTR